MVQLLVLVVVTQMIEKKGEWFVLLVVAVVLRA